MSQIAETFQRTGHRAWERAMAANMNNIVTVARSQARVGSLLDLGCDAGGRTAWVAEQLGAKDVHGVEIVEERALMAEDRGVRVERADLSDPLPYEDETFDVVVSNQVIEHLPDTDMFVRETFRVLKPGGRAAVSTENLASWHNVAALFLGWQPFSLTNVSEEAMAVGNPLGIHRGEEGEQRGHLRVFAYRGLRELFELHGFVVERVLGAGYYPLPERAARLDPRHAHFLTVGAQRPAPRF